jgi:two-component system, chemotaxis family, chemotaxis protein CheY
LVSILVVDDSDYVRSLLKTILEEAGYTIIGEADHAEKAIKEYHRLHPDIVLMDVVLETSETGKNGLDALKEILKGDPSAKVLICSGLNEQILINEAMAAGAKGFIPKPFEIEKLIETILCTSDLGIITEIGNIGVGRAATSLSKITNQPIEIDIPKIETVPAHLVSHIKWSPDQPVTGVHMGLRGQNGCDILLAFKLDEAAKISDFMTEKIRKTDVVKIQNSAIQEMSSITICSFFSAISDFLELKLLPFGPTLVTDSFSAILDSFIANMTVSTETAVLFNIHIKKQNNTVDGVLVAFLSPEFQKRLINLGKQLIDIEQPALEPLITN